MTENLKRNIRTYLKDNFINLSVPREDGTFESLKFDCLELEAEIFNRLALEGASSRLISFASGKKGPEAIEAINSGWKLITENGWKNRNESQNFSIKELKKRLDQLSPDKREEFEPALKSLGLLN